MHRHRSRCWSRLEQTGTDTQKGESGEEPAFWPVVGRSETPSPCLAWPLSWSSRQLSTLDQSAIGNREIRAAPGRKTTKEPFNSTPCCVTRSVTALANVLLMPAGYRIKTTPALSAWATKASHPKSLSSVSRTRHSWCALSISSWSTDRCVNSLTAITSWPASRKARTTPKSQLSSARNRIRTIYSELTGYISSWATVSAA